MISQQQHLLFLKQNPHLKRQVKTRLYSDIDIEVKMLRKKVLEMETIMSGLIETTNRSVSKYKEIKKAFTNLEKNYSRLFDLHKTTVSAQKGK